MDNYTKMLLGLEYTKEPEPKIEQDQRYISKFNPNLVMHDKLEPLTTNLPKPEVDIKPFNNLMVAFGLDIPNSETERIKGLGAWLPEKPIEFGLDRTQPTTLKEESKPIQTMSE